MRTINEESGGQSHLVLKGHPWVSIGFAGGALFSAYVALDMLLGPAKSSTGIAMFSFLAAFLAYGAYFADHRMIVANESLAWRRLGGFGWHRVEASEVTDVMLSPGNGFNQAILVLHLHDGCRIEAGMPNVSDEERDQAFEMFRKGVEEANRDTRR